MNAFDHIQKIRSAVWLLLLLESNSERSQSGWLVLGGRPVFDSQAANVLKVSRSTITRWRRRLTSLGFIDTEPIATGGHRITLVSKNASGPENFSVSPAAESRWPSMNSEVVH